MNSKIGFFALIALLAFSACAQRPRVQPKAYTTTFAPETLLLSMEYPTGLAARGWTSTSISNAMDAMVMQLQQDIQTPPAAGTWREVHYSPGTIADLDSAIIVRYPQPQVIAEYGKGGLPEVKHSTEQVLMASLPDPPSGSGTFYCRRKVDYYYNMEGNPHAVYSILVCNLPCAEPKNTCEWITTNGFNQFP
jgi:hypothetical protein